MVADFALVASRHWRVPAEAKGERLDQHLSRAFPELTRSRIKTLIDEGRATVNGAKAKPALRLGGGEAVLLELPRPPPSTLEAENIPLKVLYEDAELVVIDKAPGMVVHPAAGHWSGTLVNALLFRWKALGKTRAGAEVRPGVVHRLDKDTSGCMVVAKTDQALAALQRSFKARQVDKTYLALVSGLPPPQGHIQTFYGRHPVHRKRFSSKVKEGKKAETLFDTKEVFDGAALIEAKLLTGRTHQIRVHFADAGHPLLGDETYGVNARKSPRAVEAAALLGRQALHAWKLEFPHPKKKKTVRVEAEVPEDFERALRHLREAAGPRLTVEKRRPR